MPSGQPPPQRPGETPDDYRRRWAAWWEGKTGHPVPEVEQGARPPGQMPGATQAATSAATGQPYMPNQDDYWVKQQVDEAGNAITVKAMPNEPGAWINPEYNTDLAEYLSIAERGETAGVTPQWRPGEYGLEQEAQEATNAVNYLDALAKGIENDIAAGHLKLAQAAEEFDRRLEAFAEAGTQMSNMWQWTVPKGSAGKPLHADIRGDLGMQPWISDPEEFDPYGQAQEMLDAMPPMSPVSSTDPYDAAVQEAEGLLG